MKTLLFFICTATSFISAAAQDSIISLSRFEQWSTQPGKLFKTEVQPLGQLNATSFALVRTTDVATGKFNSAIRLQGEFTRNTNIVSTSSVYIDSAELENTVNALRHFEKHLDQYKPEQETILSYNTEDGVQIGFSNLNGVVNLWFTRLYQLEKRPYSGSMFSFNKRRLPDIIRILENAMELNRKQQGTSPSLMVK